MFQKKEQVITTRELIHRSRIEVCKREKIKYERTGVFILRKNKNDLIITIIIDGKKINGKISGTPGNYKTMIFRNNRIYEYINGY